MSALAHITILLSLLGFTITLDSNASCYYPNGDTNENVYPCTRFVVNGEASCCWKNDICTSTGFCMSSTIGLFYRGLCTKRDWDTNACPNYCMQDEWRGQTIAVMACNDTVFACGYASDAGNTCDGGDSSATFAVTSRNSMTQYQVLPGSPSTPENVTIYAADDATVSSSMSGPLCEASATAPSERDNHSKSTEVGLGVGLGIPLLIALAASIILSVLLLRRGKSGVQQSPGEAWAESKATTEQAELPTKNYASELPATRSPVESHTPEYRALS